MSTFLERFGIHARSPDPRPLSEIAADIDEELASHVDASAGALADEGLDVGSARAEALRRFGDYGRIRRECARTQMGERIVLQRIQVVLTVVLIAVVGLLFLSNRESQAHERAALDAEKQVMAALIARLDAQLAADADPTPAIDRRSAANAKTYSIGSGGYLNWDGQEMDLVSASGTWEEYFHEQDTSWRHGLKVVGKLAELPGTQGVEILTQIWGRLSVEHREQIMKPFVFDGGHPHAIEVLALGYGDEQTSVKERAVLYLYTYSWKDLWNGDGAGSAWFAENRERPVAEVLRESALLWAREMAGMAAQHEHLVDDYVGRFLEATESVRPETFAKAGVDLGPILEEAGVCALGPDRFADLSPKNQMLAERVLTWCKP